MSHSPLPPTDHQSAFVASRYESVDMLRTLAIFAVVCIHTEPFAAAMPDDDPLWMLLAHFVGSTLSLFAVPFFFAVSGFFFGNSHQRTGSIGRTFRRFALRIGTLFVVWSLAYDVFLAMENKWTHGAMAVVTELQHLLGMYAQRPGHFLLCGGSYQLWFLASLLQAAIILSLLTAWRRPGMLLPIAVALYLLGLPNQGYDLFHMGIPGINTRVGPFFSTLFFALGYRISFNRPNRPGLSTFLVLLGTAMLFAERGILELWLNGHVGEYYLGSVPLGIGLMLWAVERSLRPPSRDLRVFPARVPGNTWSRLGQLSLGVYATHVMFIDILESMDWRIMDHWTWDLLFPVLVYAGSLLTTLALARLRPLRQFLT